MIKPAEWTSIITFGALAMTDTPPPPPPPGFPPMPPPPPPPHGFEADQDEEETSEFLEDVSFDDPIDDDTQEVEFPPPPPPPGFSIPEPSVAPPPPPLPPGLLETTEEEEQSPPEDPVSESKSSTSEDYIDDFSESFELEFSESEENDSLESALSSLALETVVNQPTPSQDETLTGSVRLASEVDAIPGDKLHATLREKEESVVNPDGSIRQQSIDGELILRNSSRKDRAWDIEVSLNNTESTDIGGAAITVRELDATESTTLPYTASGPKMMVIREHIDTEPERPQEASLSMALSPNPQEVLIRIIVENHAPIALSDVEIRRSLPENFSLSEGPEYDVKDSELIWRIGRLPVGEISTLEIRPQVTTRSIQRFSTGVLRAMYSSESTVSRTKFQSIKSRARQFGYVSPKEDDRPDIFHCKLVVENRSSFVVSLSAATVWVAGRNEPFLEMEDIREDIPPEGLWDSIEKRLEAIERPNFTHEVDYSILPRANVESTGQIEVKERSIKVLDASVKKKYSISRIRSYVSSELDASIVIENTGSAPINVIRLLDDIPGVFQPPSPENIRVDIEGVDLKDDQYRIEVVDGTQLEEEFISPDSQGHALRITVGTSAPLGLQPGKSLLINYPLRAEDPSPMNDILVGPARADFSMERFGPVATRYCLKSPLIRVVHRRRRYSTGKEIFPAAGAGCYEIILMFQNDSDSALEDLILQDIVPGTFNIEKSIVRSNQTGEKKLDYSKESAREGTHVSWPIGRIEKEERIEVSFEIRGDNEGEFKVSDAQDYHGASFGDQVDEEPNQSEWLDENMRGASKVAKSRIEQTSTTLENIDPIDSILSIHQNQEKELEKNDTDSEAYAEENVESYSENCPVCGTESSLGASSCETCGYQFK